VRLTIAGLSVASGRALYLAPQRNEECAMKLVPNTGSKLATDAVRQARSISRGAAAGRAFGLNEGIDNHFTVMLPGTEDRSPASFGFHWSELKASDLIIVDYDGRTIEGEGEAESTLSTFIHASTRRARAPVACSTRICRMRPPSRCRGRTLEPAHQNALRFYDDVAMTTPSMVWCSMSTRAIGWRVACGEARAVLR